METFKIRASGCGEIMTSPKTKAAKEAGELSETSKTYCKIWNLERKYNRKKVVTSKHMEKGILQEDQGIDLYAKVNGHSMLLKNDVFFEDEFMTGTPDILTGSLLVDIKCSWDLFTFPFYEINVPVNYYMQLQIYMHLTGLNKSKLAYVLLDTPEHLIEREAWNYCNSTGYKFDEVIDKFKADMTYEDIPEKERIKTYEVEYDPLTIERIQNRVLECRSYITTLK